MIGNDIVDLNLAEKQSNWKRKGFLDKLFSTEEQRCIFESNLPFRTVWKLWSMKESAYKIHVRSTGLRSFNPKRFSCELTSEKDGLVYINEISYRTSTEPHNDLIHTIAVETGFDQELFYGMIITEDQLVTTSELYKKMIKDFAERKRMPIHDVQVKKNNVRIPELYIKNRKLKGLCSLSHHGKYGAYLTTAL